MTNSNEQFGDILQRAVALIAYNEKKSRQIVYDELGYALNRDGASPVQYWAYRDKSPARVDELEDLARLLVQRGGLRTLEDLRTFLQAGHHMRPQSLCRELFPPANANTRLTPEAEIINDGIPFLVGPPILQPHRFYGRGAELRRIYTALRGSTLQHVAITGLQRSGKTSLLHYISKITHISLRALRPAQVTPDIPRGMIQHWAFIDFQDPRTQTRQGFFESLLHQFGLPVSPQLSLSQFTNILCDQLKDNSVILVDEIQVALTISEFDLPFWGTLRSLGTNLLEGRLGYIISSQKKAADLTTQSGDHSPFFNIFGQNIQLGPFLPDEALELINSAPVAFSPSDVEWILKTSQYWPAPLQSLCQARWRALQEGQNGDEWKTEALAGLKMYAPLFTS